MMTRRMVLVVCGLIVAWGVPGRRAWGQSADDLATYYGFDTARIVVADGGCGPVVSADFNADGLPDLALANNRKSRIELYLLRAAPRGEDEIQRRYKVNDLPENPWYDHVKISVAHRVTALRAYDFDADGSLDIVYAGANPSELVVLRQTEPGAFAVYASRRVRNLAGGPSLEIADVLGDASPELLTIADGGVRAYAITESGEIGAETRVGTGNDLVALFTEDFDGDGLLDVLAVAPDDAMPLRLWLQRLDPRSTEKSGLLTAELRFEMPGLTEVQPVRTPGRSSASIAVIERASRRMVLYDLASKQVDAVRLGQDTGAERQVQAEVVAFEDGAAKGRSLVVGDVTGDGLADLLATNQKGNAISLYRQEQGVGLTQPEPFPTFKEPKSLAFGPWDGGDRVFVLSQEEKVVGVSRYEDGRLTFPAPLALATPGSTPVVMQHLLMDGEPVLAVVVKLKRDYILELHRPGGDKPGEDALFKLKGLKRDPGSILATDADRDGKVDLLMFTPGEPMVMVRPGADEDQVLTRDDMPQFGLVGAAGPDNTALFDIDGDETPELLIADKNFVRACAFDAGHGWRVIDQINDRSARTELVGLATMRLEDRPVIVASDKAGGRLLMITRDADGLWGVRDRVRLHGFPVGKIFAGSFSGGGTPGIMCAADDGFALVHLAGSRVALSQFAAYRSDSEDRFEHDIEYGDVNGDGYTDLVVIDAGEQMCEIFTLSASRKLYPATEFEVFQSRLFHSGQSREYEPSAALVADLTGDGADDILLIVHDRLMIYPQMTGK